MSRYKELQAVALGVLVVAMASCRHASTTIVESENGNTKRIEYSGQVVFSKDRTEVQYISEGGYVKFEHNGKTIEAENDGKGYIVYEYNGSHSSPDLDAEGKQFLAEAVGEMAKQQQQKNR